MRSGMVLGIFVVIGACGGHIVELGGQVDEGGRIEDGGRAENGPGLRDGAGGDADASLCHRNPSTGLLECPSDAIARDAGSGETGHTSSEPPSCAPGGLGMTNCGPGGSGSESCCASLEVTGGTFDRGYEGVRDKDAGYPASVSGFRLDRYEITVGRFRQFVSAVVGGWLPAGGSGKHTHLNGGNGLNATGGGYEPGWDALNWNSLLANTSSGWNNKLSCDAPRETWTASAGANETKPINCENWYEAYAFCIWDGGFLPSEAESDYAAAGGGGADGQRAYPWSIPSTSKTIDCSYADYRPCGDDIDNVGTQSPKGDGRYGQADLAGNVWEWNLDWHADAFVNPCTDCANLTASAIRVFRGGGYGNTAQDTFTSTRNNGRGNPGYRDNGIGARCARAP